jgi:hypothetical protein
MKKLILGITSLIFIASSFSSCTIQKRVHQEGYHISWKHRHTQPAEIAPTEHETVLEDSSPETKPNVHSVETISASSSLEQEVITPSRKSILSIKSDHVTSDTIVPAQEPQQEEYFSNTYTPPARPDELQDIKLANWALGLGIGAVSAPVWGLVLFFLLGFFFGAAGSSVSIYTIVGIGFLIGISLFLALEILAITFAIRFLKLHAKDPNYTKYRKRAITGLILAGIYPALLLLNFLISLAAI